MSDNSFKNIRNSVIATVIAAIILLMVPTIREYIGKFFSWLWMGVVWFWNVLISSHSLPGWAWLLIFLLALFGLLSILFAILEDIKKPEYSTYIEDVLWGVKWRWDWDANQVTNLWCYCPQCDATLVYNDSSCRNLYATTSKTDFICEYCNNAVVGSITGGDREYALGAVRREIDRKVRTNEYTQK